MRPTPSEVQGQVGPWAVENKQTNKILLLKPQHPLKDTSQGASLSSLRFATQGPGVGWGGYFDILPSF